MKKLLAKSIGTALLVFGASAQAGDDISINDTQLGVISDVASFNWTPGSALGVKAVNISNDINAPTQFDLFVQGALGNYIRGGSGFGAGSVINGTGLNTDYEITFEAGFTESGFSTSITPTLDVAIFELAPTQTVNFFNIYYDTVVDSDALAGTGYGASVTSVLILEATVTGNHTTFGIPDNTVLTDLDLFGANDYPGVGTVIGNGGGSLEANIDTLNSGGFNFFNDTNPLISILVDLNFNTSNITPFNQTNPSALVVSNAPNFAPAFGAGGYNFLNGLNVAGATDTFDFLFQADANQSFTAVAVPEPSLAILVGLSLLGLGMKKRKSV